ncbi:MAG: tetratricopeptide repeat protein [bacterium]
MKDLKPLLIISISLIVLIVGSVFLYLRVKEKRERIRNTAIANFEKAEKIKQKGNFREAVQVYERATEVKNNPNYIEAEFKKANIYRYQLNDIAKAKEGYEKILKLRKKYPQNRRMPDSLVELSSIYIKERKSDAAIELLEIAREEYPFKANRRSVLAFLSQAYKQKGDLQKAQEISDKINP